MTEGGQRLETERTMRVRDERLSAWSKISLIVLACLAVVAALHVGRDFLIPTAVAALAALALRPLAAALERLGVNSFFGASLITVSLGAAAISLIYAVAPDWDEWSRNAPDIISDLEAQLQGVEESLEAVDVVASEMTDMQTDGSGEDSDATVAENAVDSAKTAATNVAISLPGMLGNLLYGFVLMFFLIAERDRLLRFLAFSVAMTFSQRKAVVRTVRRLQTDVSHYLFTITLINMALGVAVYLTMEYLGVPSPALWGFAMAILNYIPYIGAATMNVVMLVVGALTFDGAMVFAPSAALFALNCIEGQIVTPSIVGQQMRVGALAAFVAVAFGFFLWGPAGALLATPILIAVRAIMIEQQAEAG